MRVMIDTNVIVDALKPNPLFEAEAQEILLRASANEIDGFVGANSLTDIFYVLRKEHGADKAKSMLRNLLIILDIVGVEPGDCTTAREKPMSDFEDSLVDVCAEKIGADFIVSRDDRFIKAGTAVKVITPGQLLESIAQLILQTNQVHFPQTRSGQH